MAYITPLVSSIIQFLNERLNDQSLSSDAKESLEVAIQCLETAYSTTAADSPLLLEEVFTKAMEEKGIKLEPEAVSDSDKIEAELLKNEGNELMKQELHEEAISRYTQAIMLDGHNAVYYSNRAAALSKLNQFNDAINDCKQAVKIDPKYSKAYGRMGLAYASIEQHTSARDCYKKALELDPDNESYKSNLSVAESKISESRGGNPQFRNPLDLGGLLNNPALMNMATQLMSDPNMQNMMAGLMSGNLNQAPTQPGGGPGAGTPSTPSSMDALLQAGQQLAAQMQATNPILVDQLRRQMNNDSNSNNQGEQNPRGDDGGNSPNL